MDRSPADWYLACALGLDRAFDGAALQPVLDAAEGLLTADPSTPEALTALVDTLTLGGLAIGATGTTASLSGCEHLISHLLDMAAMADGTEHDLHGAQVGVASVVAAALWEIALEEVGSARSTRGPGAARRPARTGATSAGSTSTRPAASRPSAGRRSSGSSTTWEEHRTATSRFLGDWAAARGDPAPLRVRAGGARPRAAAVGRAAALRGR